MALTIIEERLAAVERLLGLTDDAVIYTSNYSGDQIDEAVGRALPGGALDTSKAPAGFGLGSASTDKIVTTKAELDAIRVNGWCYYNGAESLVTEADFKRATIRTDTSGRTITQTAYPFLSVLYQNCTLQRTLLDTVTSTEWGAWEWVNPPMILGWEYRTTERYLGKPVYAKLVNFGALPNASSKSVAHNLASPLNMVDGKITDSNGSFVTNYNIKNFAISTANMIVETETDMSGVSAYILLKYTKTTD